MTDAVAAWFLRSYERGDRPWAVLRELTDAECFTRWLEEMRQSDEMRNDDVTIVWADCL